MPAIPTQELLTEAGCYICYTGGDLVQSIKLALIARRVLVIMPTADVTPQALLTYAQCYACFTNGNMGDLMELALLDQMSQAV